MRTTIDIPDELMKKAKIRAIEEGLSLKEFFIQSLENHLANSGKKQEAPWEKLRGMGTTSNLTPEDSGFD